MNRILAIVRKELVDAARDRRTVLVSLFSAVAGGPIMLVLLFNFMATQADRARDITLPVAGREHAPALMSFLEREEVKLTEAPTDYEARIRRGDLDVAVVVDGQFEHDLEQGRPGTVRLVFDRSRDRGRPIVDQVQNLLRAYNRTAGAQRLILRGVTPSVANPLNVEDVDLSTPQQSGALLLFLVGFYAMFAGMIGSMAPALDTSAGERERQSLEPLLMTPARPLEIALGKWLAVSIFAALVVGCTLLLFYLTLSFAPLPPVGLPFLFGGHEVGRLAVVLLPLVLLFPALLLYLAARGRTVKEAQANVSAIMFVIAFVPAASVFLQWREPAWIAAVPIAGQFTLMKLALRGEALPALQVAASYLAPVVITVLALAGVTRLLSRESVLSGR
ncbi:MAG TPA: ABC transporter permease [Casimicrobiaceae bacterium]|jgi:sodium transport system permease protein|nr:ABC transporter permease [Casimicrobiaceae bacterium]